MKIHIWAGLIGVIVSVSSSSLWAQAQTTTTTPSLARDWIVQVNPPSLIERVKALASFGTRHTLSATDDPARGIGAAREWIKAQMLKDVGVADSGNPFTATSSTVGVGLEKFELPKGVRIPNGATIVNVVGIVPGTADVGSSPDLRRAYYVVGHYDSRNAETMDGLGDSPGANDDASGTAVVMELFRIVAKKPLEQTTVFLCTAGEEQGLLGARAHAETIASRKPYIIAGVLNNDIVGDPTQRPGEQKWPEGTVPTAEMIGLAKGPDPRMHIRVFSEGVPRNANAEVMAKIRLLAAESDSASRQLARFVDFVAQREQMRLKPVLVFRPDRFLRGGDHSAFNEAGFAAVRFTTVHEDYSRQHQNVSEKDGKPYGDVESFVSEGYLGAVARLNLAALVHLANAPAVPGRVRIITAALDHETLLRWDAVKDGDVAGYEIVWRETTDWQWRQVLDVGMRTEAQLPLNKDNVFFGVRAYDKDGYRSPVGFALDGKE